MVSFIQPNGIEILKNLGIDLKSGIGEYIDNSIESKATEIHIGFLKKTNEQISFFIVDNGVGVNSETLPYVLSFGGEHGSIEKKDHLAVGRFHVGATIASLALNSAVKVYSKAKESEHWYSILFDIEEIKKTNEINNAVVDDLPFELKKHFQYESGMIYDCAEISRTLITLDHFYEEIEELYCYINETYYEALQQKKVSITIYAGSFNDVRICEPYSPLLTIPEINERYKINNLCHYVYRDIIRLSDFDPMAEEDSSLDLEISFSTKQFKTDKMLDVPKNIRLNQDNQGIYIYRHWKLAARALKIGFKMHNDFNGVRAIIKVNGKFDDYLGIQVNKSKPAITEEFVNLLDGRMRKVFTFIRKVSKGDMDIVLNPPSIEISKQRVIVPEVLAPKSLLNATSETVSQEGKSIDVVYVMKAKKEEESDDQLIQIERESERSLFVKSLFYNEFVSYISLENPNLQIQKVKESSEPPANDADFIIINPNRMQYYVEIKSRKEFILNFDQLLQEVRNNTIQHKYHFRFTEEELLSYDYKEKLWDFFRKIH